MLHQYNPQRFTFREIGGAIRKVGTVPVGAILRLPAGTKIRVEAWIPRDYATRQGGVYTTKRIAGGHMAQVRRLSDNLVFSISDVFLVNAPEA
ncbi:hypothetical protein FAZ78_22875 [Cereibacter changlensis]|jgi:hypothetical protein|uniref:Uncharacterized protein n=2 Tax=Cereibacter changlensis TaxID=402884 RepID=A0A4U0YV15_9RHOB|nr:hypothetical protein [Cereibacter changlensis]TKA94336.1 hypothetical protein FAZ78_22875 [Cereibacter changlensis]